MRILAVPHAYFYPRALTRTLTYTHADTHSLSLSLSHTHTHYIRDSAIGRDCLPPSPSNRSTEGSLQLPNTSRPATSSRALASTEALRAARKHRLITARIIDSSPAAAVLVAQPDASKCDRLSHATPLSPPDSQGRLRAPSNADCRYLLAASRPAPAPRPPLPPLSLASSRVYALERRATISRADAGACPSDALSYAPRSFFPIASADARAETMAPAGARMPAARSYKSSTLLPPTTSPPDTWGPSPAAAS